MIKAVIFDCFGVLATDVWRAFCDTLPVGDALQQARDLNKAYDSGLITHQAFVDGVKELTGKTPPDIEKIASSEMAKNEVLLNYIAELKKQNYKIGLLSNISSDWITREFLSSKEQQLFDDMVFSYKVGMTKPDPDIFTLAAKRLGVETTETIMVDDIPSYCMTAEQVGMKAVCYENFAQFIDEFEPMLRHA